jgi:hypothetical protein
VGAEVHRETQALRARELANCTQLTGTFLDLIVKVGQGGMSDVRRQLG